MAKKRYTDEELNQPMEPPSLLRRVGNAGLSGLSIIGNVLDLPSSSVRDVLAGQNPLDQWASPTRSLNRTSGRDLLRTHGLIGQKDTYGNFFGGLAAEIALDPLLPLSLGTKAVGSFGKLAGKAGIHGLEAARIASKAAKAGRVASTGARWIGPREARHVLTGDLIKEFAPEQFKMLESTVNAGNVLASKKGKKTYDLVANMQEPLGGLLNFWPTNTVIGQGGNAQKIARGMDVAGDFIRHARIPGTTIRPVGDLTNFVNRKSGFATNAEDLQSAYHKHHVAEGVRYTTQTLGSKWANDLISAGHRRAEVLEVRNWFEFPNTAPAEVQPLVAEVREFVDQIPALAKEMGVRIYDLGPITRASGSDAQYFMRHLGEGVSTFVKGKGSLFDPFASAAENRMAWTFGAKGGTGTVARIAKDPVMEKIFEQITKDPANANAYRKTAAQYLEHAYGQELPAEFLRHGQIRNMLDMGETPSVANAKRLAAKNPLLSRKLSPKNTYNSAVRSLEKMTPNVRKSGIYSNHPLVDFLRSATSTMDKLSTTKVALQRVVDSAVQAGTPGSVPIKSLLPKLRLSQGDQSGGAMKWLADNGLTDPANAAVPEETAKFLTQMTTEIGGGAESSKAIVRFYDDFANLTKHVFTDLKLNFNPRNLASGQVSNWLSGQFVPQKVADANTLVRGGVLKGAADNPFVIEEWARRHSGPQTPRQIMAASAGPGGPTITNAVPPLDDATATKILREMLSGLEATGSYGVSSLGHHGQGQVGSGLEDIVHSIPGGHPFTWKQVGEKLSGGHGKTWNPFRARVRGVGGASETTFAPGAAGEDFSYWTESMNRIAPTLALMDAGVHPNEAIQRVLNAQVGYQGRFYTPFERQVLKRLFLFYSFSKGQLPFTLQQLVENPGGRLAQTLRGINQFKDEDELVPAHVAETASIPLGGRPDGTKRYITGLGLGFEDPAQFAQPSLQNAMLEFASRTNPLLKGPLEHMTGQSFFQRGPSGGGRSLEDLDPALGRTLANIGQVTGLRDKKSPVTFPGGLGIEHMLSNSPLSTLLTTARTATDSRKGLLAKAVNLSTGLRLTDVSPQSQDRELMNRASVIEKQLLGAREYRDTFIPKDRQAEFTPKEQEMASELKALRRLLEERRKLRK